MYFFLQGKRQIGKSFLFLNTLSPIWKNVAGYYVQRLYTNEKVVGFRAVNALDGIKKLDIEYSSNLDNVFFCNGKHDISVLEKIILQVENDCQKTTCNIILLDEIGGIELASSVFMQSLKKILHCQKKCAGVIKSKNNLNTMIKFNNLTDAYLSKHAQLMKIIANNGTVKTMNNDNYNQCQKQFLDFVYNKNA